MKNQKGITLITAIITVIMLIILAGVAVSTGINIYEDAKVTKFETNMKIIQKKVDIMVEEENQFLTLGSSLTNEQKEKLQMIINNDTKDYIETQNASIKTLRYFSSSDLENVFDIKDIKDDIVINFANREVISLNGVKKDGVMHYVEYGLH